LPLAAPSVLRHKQSPPPPTPPPPSRPHLVVEGVCSSLWGGAPSRFHSDSGFPPQVGLCGPPPRPRKKQKKNKKPASPPRLLGCSVLLSGQKHHYQQGVGVGKIKKQKKSEQTQNIIATHDLVCVCADRGAHPREKKKGGGAGWCYIMK